MKKITGKALALVLSLALVVSSFSANFASASTTKTITGSMGDDDYGTIYLVNGGSGAGLTYADFGKAVSGAITSKNDPAGELSTERHKTASDVEITSISRASGDSLVKWYDTKDSGSIDTDTNNDITLALRNASVSGTEVLSVLYKGTWTDDNDTEYTVKGTQKVTVVVYNKYQTVIGEVSEASSAKKTKSGLDELKNTNIEGPLDDTFAQKTLKHEIKDSGTKATDISDNDGYTLCALRAIPTGESNALVRWQALKTKAYNTDSKKGDVTSGYTSSTSTQTDTYYVMKSSSDNIVLTTNADGTVDARVADGASTGSLTLTDEATYYAKNKTIAAGDTYSSDTADIGDAFLYTSKDVKEKSSVEKEIIVNTDDNSPDANHTNKAGTNESNFTKFGKYSGTTYLYSGTLDKDHNYMNAIKVNGYEVHFVAAKATAPTITVADNANVQEISGEVGSINASSGTISTIDVDDASNGSATKVSVDEAKVTSIDTDGDVSVTSAKASTGSITAENVNITSGTTGDIVASGKVDIKAQDDDTPVKTGDIKAVNVDIDSEDSKVTTGTIKSKAADGEIDLIGDNISIKAIDFNYYNTNLKFDDFQGTIAAPLKADEDGATISTNDTDDKAVVTGDVNINSISIDDESQITFTGAVTANSIDGSGKMIVGLNKLYVSGSASGVILKLSDATFKKGDVAFTSLTDTVDTDSFDTYGFTLAKTTGTSKDTFKIDAVSFKGLTVSPSAVEIAKGYSQTFTASAYAPGTTIPSGYKVQFSLDGASDSLTLVDNGNGTAKVTATGYDATFDSENKATLTAQLVDADGSVDEDYDAGECSVTAIAVPVATATSDTTGNLSVAQGASYQFKITTTDGKAPTFGAGSASFKTTAVGSSGNAFFYKITAVGKVGDVSGIYLNGTKVATATVTASTVKIDTSKVTIKAGQSYQFKVTAASKPAFGVGSSAAKLVSTKVVGSDYFFTVQAAGKAGDKVGVYVNGIAMAVITIG